MLMTEDVAPRMLTVQSEVPAAPAMLKMPASAEASVDKEEETPSYFGPGSAYEPEEKPVPAAVRYNRFWSEGPQKQEGGNDLAREQEMEGTDALPFVVRNLLLVVAQVEEMGEGVATL